MGKIHIDAYPDCRQFPFDEVCDNLVRALEAMDFNAKGITVETSSKIINGVEEKYVEFIKGKDFVVYFRRMCLINEREHINDDIASVFQIIIPKKTLQVFPDESGPNLFVYSGDDYEKNKDQWLHGPNTYRFGKQLPKNHFLGACNCTTDRN